MSAAMDVYAARIAAAAAVVTAVTNVARECGVATVVEPLRPAYDAACALLAAEFRESLREIEDNK